MWTKLLPAIEHALLIGLAVALTYILQHVSATDLGTYGPLAVGVIGVVLAAIKSFTGPDLPKLVRKEN